MTQTVNSEHKSNNRSWLCTHFGANSCTVIFTCFQLRLLVCVCAFVCLSTR